MQALHEANLVKAWNQIWAEVQEYEPETIRDVKYSEKNKPRKHDVRSFYEMYVWAVYNSGMAVESLNAIWDRIAFSLFDFVVADIAQHLDIVSANLMRVNKHPGKAEAVLDVAVRLAEDPGIWTRMQALNTQDALRELRKLKYMGPSNSFHVLRNMGWDVPTHSGFALALADEVGLDCETLVAMLAKASGWRSNTTDMVLGIWNRLSINQSDDAHCIQRFRALSVL